ncbi:MAG: hypothetical protein C0404_13275 [Verrucomicrobia bacterium]|nr:hypothetical protein [Verrucomicrobiota bacterium]
MKPAKHRWNFPCCPPLLCILLIAAFAGSAAAGQKRELWFYYATNLQVDENVAKLEAIWRRAAGAGFGVVMLTDSKFSRLGDLGSMEGRYFANVARTRKLADDLKLRIVPVVYPMGWSNCLLWHNPNLAEGLPVKDALFVVKGGQAGIVADPPVGLAKPNWKDDTVSIAGNVATVENPGANSRFVYNLKLPKYRSYHVSVSIKTEGFTGKPEIKPLAAGRALQFQDLDVKKTQDWTQCHVVFNTLENEEVILYFGVWGGAKGKLQWRDWKIEESGLINVLRRPGAPFSIKGYVEGKDYEKVEDPNLGNKPWKGEYTSWHEPPAIKTKLPDGTQLRVSWFHPAIIYEGSVMCCVSEPQTMELLADEARRVTAAWKPKAVMMGHDEIRILNRDEACQGRGLDAGALLADNAKACVKLLNGCDVLAWSDMFDPNHNARKDYYLVRGDLTGSWEGLDKSVTVVNWNFEHRDKSLKFFAGRGHKQVIAGYYDGAPAGVKDWLVAADKVDGVVGVMYTTWVSKYDDLEAFAKVCKEHEAK